MSLVKTQHAARYLGISCATLVKQRTHGAAPRGYPVVPWVRRGREVFYDFDTLAKYKAEHLSNKETTQPGTRRVGATTEE